MRGRVLAPLAAAIALTAAGPASSAEPTKKECLAANDAAQDQRKEGKLIEARAKLVLCVATSCPGPVREDCAQRLTEVDAAMPSIVFEAKDAHGNDVAAVRVTVDGQPFAAKLDGAPVQVDPGEHRFSFDDADGFAHVEKTVVAREGDKGRHVAIVLGAAAPQAVGRSTTAAVAPAPSDGSAQRTWGFVVGGAGVAGIVVGGVFGLVAKSTYDGEHCPKYCAAVPSDALAQATVSTVGFIAGGALLAGGAFLYFTAPSVAVGPTVGAGGAGLSIRGAW